MGDRQYQSLPRPERALLHEYGAGVEILSYPYPMTLLAELCSPDTVQPSVNALVARLFDWLFAEVASRHLPTHTTELASRMQEFHPEGVYQGQVIDRDKRAVVVDVARAGILPSLRFFDGLNHILAPENVRLDHIVASRETDDAGNITGIAMDGSKIGGPVDGAIVMVPDPMGATGTSLSHVLDHYRDQVEGTPAKVVAVHLIVTPEYIANMQKAHPEVEIVAIRLDRGLSSADVLASIPGTHWADERGLNAQSYIVPGGGGLGEVMNNAWV